MKAKIFDNIDEVPKATWNRLLEGRSCPLSHEFWKVIEMSKLNNFTCRYVLLFDDTDNAIALATFYSVNTDIAIFAPRRLRRLLAIIRCLFPKFLVLRMLEWGTPLTVCSPPFVSAKNVEHRTLVQHIHALLLQTARTERRHVIVVRDFEPNETVLANVFTSLGYHWVDSLPNTYMNIGWPSMTEYYASMKSYYRSKLLKHVRRNTAGGIRYELTDNFDHLAARLCNQWLVVHNTADEFQREVLTPEFYRAFSRCLGPRSKALLFYRGHDLIGHALLLQDGDQLNWMYFGREVAINDSLYLYVAHSVIETAIRLGVARVQMGLTTYSVKQDLGAAVTPVKIAIRAVSPLLNPFVPWIYRALNRPPRVRGKHVFKAAACILPGSPAAR